MRGASIDAQNFANSMNVVALSEGEAEAKVLEFTNAQKMSAVSSLAQNKSLGNVRTIINEYNSGMVNCGLSQEQFIKSVGQSNATLGKYLSNVNVGSASMRSYVGSLVASKAATIGLQIATTALNAVIGMGIGLLISGAISAITTVIHYEENLIQKSEEAADAIKELSESFKNDSKTVTEISKRFAELAQGIDSLTGKNISLTTDEYAEFLDLSNQLADIFPTLSRNYDENGNAIVNLSGDVDTIVGSLNNLLEVQRQIANQDIVDQLPDLYKGVVTKSNNFKKDIEYYNNQIQEIKKSYDDIISSDFAENFGKMFQEDLFVISGAGKSVEELDEVTDDYLKLLDELGLKYEYLSTEYGTDESGLEIPVGFNYRITSFDGMSDEEIEQAKAKIQQGVRGLAEKYSNEIDNFYTQIQTTENKNKANWSSVLSSISAWLSTDSSYQSMNDDMQSIVQTMVNNVDFSSLDFSSWQDLQEYISENILQILNAATPETQKALADLFKIDTSSVSFAEYKKEIQNGIKAVAESFGKDPTEIMALTGLDTVLGGYEEVRDKIKNELNLSDAIIDSLSVNDLSRSWDYVVNYGIKSWDDLVSFIEAKDFAEAFNIDDIEELEDALDDLKDTWDDINDIIEDYNENGYLSIDNLKDIMDMDAEYINLLIDENGQINLNTQAYKDYIAAKAKMLVLDQVKSLYSSILEMGIEEAQAYANAEAYDVETGSLLDLISATYQYYSILAKAKDDANGTTAYMDALERSQYTTANYLAMYDSWLNSLSTSQNEFNSSVKTTEEALKEEKKALEDAKDALEDYQDELEDAQSDLQDLIDLVTEYIKQMKAKAGQFVEVLGNIDGRNLYQVYVIQDINGSLTTQKIGTDVDFSNLDLSIIQDETDETKSILVLGDDKRDTSNNNRGQLVYVFINSDIAGVINYSALDSFVQNPAANITIGSEYAEIEVYKVQR